MELCAQAADEQDPKRLMQLVDQINQLLEQKEARLLRSKPSKKVADQGTGINRPNDQLLQH
jgi:hypothetical protein